MSHDQKSPPNQEPTDDHDPEATPATSAESTGTATEPSPEGSSPPSVFYTTRAGGGQPEQLDWAAASTATICAIMEEGELPDIQDPSPPEETMILCRTRGLAEAIAANLKESGYSVFLRGTLGDRCDLVKRTEAYLMVLAAPSPEQRDEEVEQIVEYFYGITPSELDRQTEVVGHNPDDIDNTWTQLTTVASMTSDTTGDSVERAALAVEDIQTLREEVGHRSIQVAFARLHKRINLRQYATSQETAGLARLANAVTDGIWVSTDSVVDSAPPLTVETVHELKRKVNEARDTVPNDVPEGCFQVGTIHSAKGDEAETVVLAGLSDQWDRLTNEDNPDTFARAVTEFTEDVGSSADISFKHRQQDNARLLLNVAVSRAADRLILLGDQPVDPEVTPPEEEDHAVPDSLAAVKEALPDVTGAPIHHPWSELLASLPDTAVDLGQPHGEAHRARFSLDDNPISETGAAIYLENQEKEDASDRFTLPSIPTGSPESLRPRPLTYSALKTAADNPADYYRQYVLGEPELDLPKTVPDDERLRERLDTRSSGSSVRHRVVGDLVHFTAETLYGTDADIDAWTDRCVTIAETIEASDAELEQATEHIERLFATDAMGYTVCGTETDVAPEIDEEPVYGRVDAVVEHPERADELLALDFKTGRRANADQMQLWFYLLGLDESDQFDRPVTEAAFVYLDDNPEVADHVTIDDTDELDAKRADFASLVATANDVTNTVLDGGNE